MDEQESAPKPAPKKTGRKPKLDPELVAAALAKNHGNISATARRFNVQRASVQELIGKRPSLQIVLRDAREGMLDEVESSLYRAAKRGEGWAVCFFLKTQGKARGYIERQEVFTNQSDFGDEVRKRLAEAESSGLRQPGEAGSDDAPNVANPAPSGNDQPTTQEGGSG